MKRVFMSKKELILYLAFEALLLCLVEISDCADWSRVAGNSLRYAAILTNTIVVCYCFCNSETDQKHSPERLIAYALFMTAAADFFMTLIGNTSTYLPGVTLFCLVQLVYALYLRPSGRSFIIRLAFYVICLLILKTAGMLNLTNALGILDISLVLVNAILAWTLARTKASLLFRIGITLFFCCDMSILIRALTTGTIHEIIVLLVWIFYIPSQVALTLSYVRRNRMYEE